MEPDALPATGRSLVLSLMAGVPVEAAHICPMAEVDRKNLDTLDTWLEAGYVLQD